MNILPKIIKKITDFFESFAEIGPRQALRLAFNLAKNQRQKNLLKSIALIIDNVKICQDCYFVFEGEGNLCSICQDPKRDKSQLCIVLSETALISMEQSQFYKGLYFIWQDFDFSKNKQKIEALKKIIVKNNTQKLIFSLPLTSESRTLIKEIKNSLGEFSLKYIEPKIGLPKGGDIEFADPETLKSAFEDLS